jgi:hypothetical protein
MSLKFDGDDRTIFNVVPVRVCHSVLISSSILFSLNFDFSASMLSKHGTEKPDLSPGRLSEPQHRCPQQAPSITRASSYNPIN